MKMTRFEIGVKVGSIGETLQNSMFWRVGNIIEKICKKISFNAADMLFDYTGWRDFEWEEGEEEK